MSSRMIEQHVPTTLAGQPVAYSDHPQYRRLALAMIRRVEKSFTQEIGVLKPPGRETALGTLTVLPFGFALHATLLYTVGYRGSRAGQAAPGKPFPILTYRPSEGLVIKANVAPTTRLALACILSAIERAGGFPRRWALRGAALVHYMVEPAVMYDIGGDTGPDATVPATPYVEPDLSRDFQVLSPLEVAMLDLEWANKRPDGSARDWRAEARAHFGRFVATHNVEERW